MSLLTENGKYFTPISPAVAKKGKLCLGNLGTSGHFSDNLAWLIGQHPNTLCGCRCTGDRGGRLPLVKVGCTLTAGGRYDISGGAVSPEPERRLSPQVFRSMRLGRSLTEGCPVTPRSQGVRGSNSWPQDWTEEPFCWELERWPCPRPAYAPRGL